MLQLESFVQEGTWRTKVWKKLSHHCPQLQSLELWPSNAPGSQLPARVSAIESFSALKHLTRLALNVWDDAELAAVAKLTQLRELEVVMHYKEGRCTGNPGVLQLLPLPGRGQQQQEQGRVLGLRVLVVQNDARVEVPGAEWEAVVEMFGHVLDKGESRRKKEAEV